MLSVPFSILASVSSPIQPANAALMPHGMDFWSRLLSPLASGSSQKDQAKDPAKRLHRFEKEYAGLLSTWRTSSNLSRDSDAAEILEIRLQELTNILNDESRRPLPHPCIQYASIKQIYVPIGKIATTSYNEWIIKEAVVLFSTLVESEEESFVENPTFSSSLTNLLVRITGVNSVRLDLDTESKVVELAFNITTKIRLDPSILPAWFKASEQAVPDENEHDKFAGRTQRVDFPLFYILMDFIHHEGKVGDFARTGLLYIIEAASSSTALEQWIVESDLSTLMATGLGALYSQLSRKLVIDHLPHDLPPILALSDYQHPASSYEIVNSCSPEFQSHLETFLSHLLFWQDVLNHCRSEDVKSTLLEHFQVIFLQQLLYPSLLESSDIDGGSSVAVLTYLRRILESLDHPDMINLILHYLLALPDAAPPKRKPSRASITAARARKSMDLATLMADKSEDAVTPLLFNLVDLILSCLRSRNQQTIHVTLQLVSAILRRHHRYAVTTLLKTEVLPTRPVHRTVGAHEQEVDYIMSLAGSIGGKADFDEMYGNTLRDMMTRLESHPCSLRLVAPKLSTNNHELPELPKSLPGSPRDVREHTLRPDDPLLNSILDLMETFFMNPVETNLSVTETMVDLAICGYMSIEGWLARNPATYSYEDNQSDNPSGENTTHVEGNEPYTPTAALESSVVLFDDEEQRIQSMDKCRTRPGWRPESVPRVLDVVKRLCDQLTSYKDTIPRFEDLLEQRREAFQTAEIMLDQPPLPVRKASPPVGRQSPLPFSTPERRSMDETLRTGSPSRPSALEGFAQRLLSELGTPSRSASPKGRRDGTRTSGTSTPAGAGSNTTAHLETPKALRVPPGAFPTSTDPLKIGIARSLSPGSIIAPSPEEEDNVVASQASEFAAIDQSILARKVGLPDDKLKPIPLDLRRTAQRNAARNLEEEHASESDADMTDSSIHSDEPRDESVSVSHILTNTIILQSFLMELASLMQVRAGLFDEVRYV